MVGTNREGFYSLIYLFQPAFLKYFSLFFTSIRNFLMILNGMGVIEIQRLKPPSTWETMSTDYEFFLISRQK